MEPYRYTVQEGDFVLFPDGMHALVTDIDYEVGCVSKRVTVEPLSIRKLKRLVFLLLRKHILWDEEIDTLRKSDLYGL